MRIRRRDMFQLGAGAGAGIALSPVPWKLLDDTAKWSQNWSWLPKLPRGERKVKETRCTLCPGGCPVQAQCVGERPVYLKGAAGPLCTLGLGGHHLALHPDRVRHASVPLKEAVEKMRAAAGRGRCVIIDQRPGRAMSEMYARFAAALPNGKYVARPSRDGATLRAMERLAGAPNGSLGLDFERLKTVVGIATPLLDGWAAQLALAAKRKADASFRVIQIDPRQSATACAADEWIAARPGTELAAALQLRERIEQDGPAILIADGDAAAGFDPRETEAIATMNLTLAAGALTQRRKLPWTVEGGEELDQIDDGSVRLLILGDATNGEALAWSDIGRRLAPDALIVSFSPYRDSLSGHARIVLPSFAAYEALEDVPTPPYGKDVSYSTAAPLHPKPLGGVSPVEVLREVAGTLEGSVDETIKTRSAAFEKLGGSATAAKLKNVQANDSRSSETPGLAMVSFGWRGSVAGISSPLVTKLYQESGLRPGSLLARVHPETARVYGLRNRDRAAIEGSGGPTREKTVCIDPAVLPGVVEVADAATGRRWEPVTMRRIS